MTQFAAAFHANTQYIDVQLNKDTLTYGAG
jgi:hypothetical protein